MRGSLAEARSIARLAGLARGVRAEVGIARSCGEARERLVRAAEWSAFIADVRLPDGDGLDIIEEMRPRAPDLPVLVLTGACLPVVAARAKSLGARFVVKPPMPEEITQFVEHAAGGWPGFSGALRLAVWSLAERSRLTARDAALLYAVAIDDRRDVARLDVGMPLSTFRAHLSKILERTGADDVRQLGAMLRAAALKYEGPTPRDPVKR